MSVSIKNTIRRIIAVLNFPTIISAFIIFAKAIIKAMTGNPNFTASAAKVTTAGTNLGILEAAQIACTTTPPTGSVQARNVAYEQVKNDLRALRSDVQAVADANPAKAQAIIVSAGMSVKKPSVYNREYNIAEDGNEEGMVELTGQGSGPHEWRMTTDGINWTLLPASRTSKCTVYDLISGQVYYFQNRMILTNDQKSEWSQSIRIRLR